MGRQLVPTSYTEVPYNGPSDPAATEESGGVVEYWRILARSKGTLILLAAIGALIGFLVTVPQTPIFQVRTSLEVVSLNQNFLNLKENSPTDVDAEDILTQIKILQSDSLLKRVMEKLQSTELPAAEPTRIDAWRTALNLPASKEDPREAALARARSSLERPRRAGHTNH